MHRVLEQGGLVILTLLAEEARSENVQLFQGLFNAILSDHPNWPQPGPSCGMDSSEWMGYLKEAHFGKIGITEYAREAAGRPNIHQEAPQILRELCEQQGWLQEDGAVVLQNTAVMLTGVKD
ncbi:hypothetical protein WJX82_009880 [Trebouxia sp. C0006]